jgi:seryl-tRNA synthetase
MGASASTKYDLEVYFPGLGRYVEVTSTSNCTDYQTRRCRARYRSGKEVKYLHSLNGTAIACGRILAALSEQGYDGSDRIILPQVLRNYGAPAHLSITPA